METLDLRKIESSSWKMGQQAGLFDMYFGILILAIAVSSLVEALGAPTFWRLPVLIVLQLSAAICFALAKRHFLPPRIGEARFSEYRKIRTRTLGIALLLCVTLTAVLVVLTSIGHSPIHWVLNLGAFALPTAIAVVVGLPLLAMSYFLEFPRILLHVALFIAATYALILVGYDVMSPIPGAIAFGTAGSISFLIGIILFVRFLRTTPVRKQEVSE